jgi:hypothetical protein
LIQLRLIAKSSFPQAKLEKRTSLLLWIMLFGEQAYETIDELLKPFKKDILLNVESVSLWVKGILEGRQR